MKLINNLKKGQGHRKRLLELFAESTEVVIASPFLMSDFSEFFADADTSNLESIHLITTLKTKSYDQFKKIDSLLSFIDSSTTSDLTWNYRISLNNKLHGKIFLFKKNGAPHCAIISSANMTDSGLAYNHEWGIELDDERTMNTLEEELLSTIGFDSISKNELEERQRLANEFLSKNPKSDDVDIDLDLTKGLNSTSNIVTPLPKIFLKPIGTSENIVPEHRIFDESFDRLDFSKRRPRSVSVGSILITYASGSGRLLGVFRSTSLPTYSTEEEKQGENWRERWPWYVSAESLAPDFGRTWSEHYLTTGMMRDEFLSENPEGFISMAGGQTLGAFSFGADKLQLDEDFGRFILERIAELSDDFSFSDILT